MTSLQPVTVQFSNEATSASLKYAPVPPWLAWDQNSGRFTRRGNGLYLTGRLLYPRREITPLQRIFGPYETRDVYLGEINSAGEVTLDSGLSASLGHSGSLFPRQVVQIEPTQFGGALAIDKYTPDKPAGAYDEVTALRQMRRVFFQDKNIAASISEERSANQQYHSNRSYFLAERLSALVLLIQSDAGKAELLSLLVGNPHFIRNHTPSAFSGMAAALQELGPRAVDNPALNDRIRNLLLESIKKYYSSWGPTVRRDLLKTAAQWVEDPAGASVRDGLVAFLRDVGETDPQVLTEIEHLRTMVIPTALPSRPGIPSSHPIKQFWVRIYQEVESGRDLHSLLTALRSATAPRDLYHQIHELTPAEQNQFRADFAATIKRAISQIIQEHGFSMHDWQELSLFRKSFRWRWGSSPELTQFLDQILDQGRVPAPPSTDNQVAAAPAANPQEEVDLIVSASHRHKFKKVDRLLKDLKNPLLLLSNPAAEDLDEATRNELRSHILSEAFRRLPDAGVRPGLETFHSILEFMRSQRLSWDEPSLEAAGHFFEGLTQKTKSGDTLPKLAEIQDLFARVSYPENLNLEFLRESLRPFLARLRELGKTSEANTVALWERSMDSQHPVDWSVLLTSRPIESFLQLSHRMLDGPIPENLRDLLWNHFLSLQPTSDQALESASLFVRSADTSACLAQFLVKNAHSATELGSLLRRLSGEGASGLEAAVIDALAKDPDGFPNLNLVGEDSTKLKDLLHSVSNDPSHQRLAGVILGAQESQERFLELIENLGLANEKEAIRQGLGGRLLHHALSADVRILARSLPSDLRMDVYQAYLKFATNPADFQKRLDALSAGLDARSKAELLRFAQAIAPRGSLPPEASHIPVARLAPPDESEVPVAHVLEDITPSDPITVAREPLRPGPLRTVMGKMAGGAAALAGVLARRRPASAPASTNSAPAPQPVNPPPVTAPPAPEPGPPQPRTCPQCGQMNPPDAQFCFFDGVKLSLCGCAIAKEVTH